MATYTEPELIGAGFVRVFGTGQRVQVWSGPDPRQSAPPNAGVNIVWDSVSGRRKVIVDGSFRTWVPLVGIAFVLNDLITAIPNATVPAITKNALKTDLLAAFMED